MPEPTQHPRPRSGGSTFVTHFSGFLGGMASYIRSRLELAGLEAKEAAVHYAVVLGLFVIALVTAVFGYFFACLAFVFGLAWLIGGEYTWIWVTVGVAVLHLGAAAAAALIAKSRIASPMFSATLDEFKKDQQWLHSTAKHF